VVFLNKTERRRRDTTFNAKRCCQPLHKRCLASAKVALKAYYIAGMKFACKTARELPRLFYRLNFKRTSHSPDESLEMLYLWLPVSGLFGLNIGVRHNDEPIAHLALPGCSTVKAANSTAALSGYRVCFEPHSIIDIGAENLLVLEDTSCLHIVRIERKRAFIIKARLSHFNTMKLRLKKTHRHDNFS
jgi:hypothetical protein